MRINWKQQLEDGRTLEGWLAANFAERTNAELGQELGELLSAPVTPGQIRGKAHRLGLAKDTETVSRALAQGHGQLGESPWRRYDDPPHVDGDVVVLADLHVPFQDSAFINRVLNLAAAWNVRQVILAGDFVDFAAFSPFGKDAEIFAEAEFDAAEEVLEVLGTLFERVLWLWGNHEDRLKRLLSKELAASRFLRLFTALPSVEISEYYWCEVGADWLVAHPRNASVIAARVPQWLAEKYGRHVASGHGHLWGLSLARSGTRLGVDLGACVDPLRLAYKSLRLDTRPALVQGALIIRGGKPWLLHPQFTDWDVLQSLGGTSHK